MICDIYKCWLSEPTVTSTSVHWFRCRNRMSSQEAPNLHLITCPLLLDNPLHYWQGSCRGRGLKEVIVWWASVWAGFLKGQWVSERAGVLEGGLAVRINTFET